jgi:hypothetical protein
MEENYLKTYFTSYGYLCKDFRYNYNEILIIFNILKNHIKDKELIDFFINDLSNIKDYLNNKTNKFSVPIPENYKFIEHYVNLYHKFIININLNTDIKQNNIYCKDYLQFMEMTSDLLYYYINNFNDRITLLLLIYTPLYGAYIIQ